MSESSSAKSIKTMDEKYVRNMAHYLANKYPTIKSGCKQSTLDEFISAVKTLDNMIKHDVEERSEQLKLRAIFYVHLRNFAIVESTSDDTAKKVLDAFDVEFGDIPSIKKKIADDQYMILHRQLDPVLRSTEQKKDDQNVPIIIPDQGRKRFNGSYFLALIIIVGFIAIYVNDTINSNSTTQSTRNVSSPVYSKPTSTPTVKATATPVPVNVFNGKRFIRPSFEELCPFTIIAPASPSQFAKTNYYVYLEYQRFSTKTKVGRKARASVSSPYESDIAFYLEDGQTVEIDVPVGVYKLYYSTGNVFFGTNLLFGDNTRCYSSDDLLEFYADDRYYHGNTVTLQKMENGNFETDPISESQFPKR